MQRDVAPPTRRNADGPPHDDPMTDAAFYAITPTCDRLGIRHYKRIERLRAVLADLQELRDLGANEPELRAYEEAVATTVDGLTSGAHATDPKTARLVYLDADMAEDHFAQRTSIEGESAVAMEQRARMLEKEIHAARVLVRALRRGARQARSNRIVATQRLGINGAA